MVRLSSVWLRVSTGFWSVLLVDAKTASNDGIVADIPFLEASLGEKGRLGGGSSVVGNAYVEKPQSNIGGGSSVVGNAYVEKPQSNIGIQGNSRRFLQENGTKPDPMNQYAWPYRGSPEMKKRRENAANMAILALLVLAFVRLCLALVDFDNFGTVPGMISVKIREHLTTPRLFILALGLIVSILGLTHLVAGDFRYPLTLWSVADAEDCKLHCQNTEYAQCDTVVFEIHYHMSRQYNYRFWDKQNQGANANRRDALKVKRMMCKFDIFPSPWVPYFVTVVSMLSIVMILEGVSADIVFTSASIIFGLMGILDVRDAYGGLSGGAVVAIGMLMIIGLAITETGWLEILISRILGNSPIMLVGLSRILSASAVMSMFLPNAPLFLLISPAVQSWARRLGFSKKKLLAPLGVALQVGGQCTILGSAAPMVAKALYPKQVYDLNMFELTPVGGITAVIMLIGSVICLPLLPSDSEESSDEPVDLGFADASTFVSIDRGRASVVQRFPQKLLEVVEDGDRSPAKNQSQSEYGIGMCVDSSGLFVGVDCETVCTQLSRLPGVTSAFPDGIASGGLLKIGDRLICRCNANGVVNLRKYRGVQMEIIGDLLELGTHRRKRHLYEAVVSSTSPLIGKPVDTDNFVSGYKNTVIGMWGKQVSHDKVVAGDMILFEAEDAAMKQTDPWSTHFSMIMMVPNSTPPRQGASRRDTPRSVFVFASFLAMVLFISFDWLPTPLAAGGVVVTFLIFKVVSVEQVFEAVKGRALLIIAGSMGVANALQRAGVANFLSNQIAQLTLPISVNLLRALIYVAAAGLSQLVSKTCTVAVLGPMMPGLATAAGVSVQSMVWLVIFAAGACFITPFGEPASIFVMKDGEYSYGQFAKYGILLQILHGIVTVFLLSFA